MHVTSEKSYASKLQLDLSAFVCYQENSDRYPAINDAQQTIPNGQHRSTWNERAVFFFTSLGFTTGNVGCSQKIY
jgi:hypothetical protein